MPSGGSVERALNSEKRRRDASAGDAMVWGIYGVEVLFAELDRS